MAEKVQINPRISPTMKGRIEEAAKARECTVGELVEAAVDAYLHEGGARTDDGAFTGQVAALHSLMLQMFGMLQEIGVLVAERPTDQDNEDTLPPVQGPDELYGPPETWEPQPLVLEPLPPLKRSFWHRVFYKEVPQ